MDLTVMVKYIKMNFAIIGCDVTIEKTFLNLGEERSTCH